MENEISLLEGKLEQLLRLVSRLREENTQLNEVVLARDTQITQLQERMTSARARVEQLVISIPDEEAE